MASPVIHGTVCVCVYLPKMFAMFVSRYVWARYVSRCLFISPDLDGYRASLTLRDPAVRAQGTIC